MTKTNALRALDKLKISYRPIEYDVSDGRLDGVSVAEKAGMDPAMVYKTLVVWGKTKAFYVFIVPVAESLDLKKAAKACGEKSVEMIPQAQLLPNTGYIHGGCSPIGMKKLFPTYLDQSAEDLDEIAVSGGRIGLQILLKPRDLLGVVQGRFADIKKDSCAADSAQHKSLG